MVSINGRYRTYRASRVRRSWQLVPGMKSRESPAEQGRNSRQGGKEGSEEEGRILVEEGDWELF